MAKKASGNKRSKNKKLKKNVLSEKILDWSKLLAQAVNLAGGEVDYDAVKEILIARTNKDFNGDDRVFEQVIDEAIANGCTQYDDQTGRFYTKYKKVLTIYFDVPFRKLNMGEFEAISPGGAIFPMEVVSEYKDNMLKIDCGWEIRYGLDGFLDITAKRHSMMIRPDQIKKIVIE